MSTPFILRLRHQKGVKRLLFSDNNITWGDVQLQIKDTLGVPTTQQLISRTPPHAPQYIEAAKSTPVTQLNLKHGDMMYLRDPTPESKKQEEKTPSTPLKIHRLTDRCRHGSNQYCNHCLEKPATKSKGKCLHGPGGSCINCSEHIADTESEPAEWLCTHPPTAFCPKCLPPEDEDDEPKQPTCSCYMYKGKKCIQCIDSGKPKKVKTAETPFNRWVSDRKALCASRHSQYTTCMNCAIPAPPSYAAKANCTRGHPASGVCLSCAPPVANLRKQEYRHCDSVAVPMSVTQEFYQSWHRHGYKEKQRGGVLFGKYVDVESFGPGAIQAITYAIYEPPQQSKATGTRFLRDPQEQRVHEVASLLGLEPVGWIITTLPRSGEKYKGKVFMSGEEMIQACRLQDRYKNQKTGYSRFVTMVLEDAKQIEPAAYMVSDQGVALVRDEVVEVGSDPYMWRMKLPKAGQIGHSVIMEDSPLTAGQDFLLDFLLNKVAPTAIRDEPFHSCSFPSDGTAMHLRSHLAEKFRQPYHVKLSDFNLLVFLSSQVGMPLTAQIAEALQTKQPFPVALSAAIDRALAEKNLL